MTEIESQVAYGFQIKQAVIDGIIDEEEALALLEELPIEVTLALAVSE